LPDIDIDIAIASASGPSRRLARLAGALALAAALCAAAIPAGPAGASGKPPSETALAVGTTTHSITVGGTVRTFLVYRPPGLHGAVPLVVMLHGGYGSDTEAEAGYRWNTEADTGHFVVAYPDGLDRAWNAGGGCCGKPAAEDVDDVGFITQMVSTIEHETPIDPDRVYVTGISNGGIMSYRLACQTSLFAAIGPVAATMLVRCPKPTPLSVIAVHGTADPRVPYNGGTGTGVAHIHGPAIPALNATWRAIDRCGAPTVTTNGVVKTSVARCPGGRSVELISVIGAGHQWPGAVPKGPVITRLLGLTPPSTALDATAVIWHFFAAHPK
jgi:polyhydroxybutyrate depolymerase